MGNYLIHFREYVIKNHQHKPTANGLAMNLDVWQRFLENLDQIKEDIHWHKKQTYTDNGQ